MSVEGPPLPGIGPDLAGDLATWVNDAAWVALVEAFGGDPATMPAAPPQRLAWLDDFSKRWDLRAGRLERDEAGELPTTTEQTDVVFRVADRLGMRSVRRPRFRDYDHVLALGGLIRACFMRPAYAAQLLESGEVRSPSFVALGGHRPFSDEERALASAAGLVDVDSEFSALDTGVRVAFGLDQPLAERGESVDTPGGSWTIRQYASAERTVLVVAAPSSEPALRRANTADAYRFMAEEVVHLTPGQRILAVTTPIYVPAQHAVAVATLGRDHEVVIDTVGTDPSTIPAIWAQEFSASRYLMEFRSAIHAMRRLV